MAKVNLVEKKIQMGHRDIIKYQIITYCFVNNLQLSSNELECLTLLGVYGEYELADFCNVTVEEGIFKTPQTVRNFLTKASKLKLVVKEGDNKKKISLSKDMKVQSSGNILLDFKVVHIASQE